MNSCEDFIRADGRCICEQCDKEYWRHRYCLNSKLPDSMQSSTVIIFYCLHVLCDGTHVKL